MIYGIGGVVELPDEARGAAQRSALSRQRDHNLSVINVSGLLVICNAIKNASAILRDM